jgi:GNAT superfamily N-acetyltransferase
MQAAISIQPVGNAWSPQIIELILPIQQLEFRVPTTLEKQPDLLDIDGSYSATGGGFWGAFTTSHATALPTAATTAAIPSAGITHHLVGTIGLIAIPGGNGVIRKMFVHIDYRGKPHNIAQHLLDALINHARTTGIQNLYLGTIHTMEAAARFYTRNGFAKVDRSSLPAAFPLMSVDDTFYCRNVYL